MMYTRDNFNLMGRIIGASRHSIHIKADDGGVIFCSNKIFNKLVVYPNISFDIVTVPEHEDRRTGRFFPETRWIQAYVPTRF